MTRLLAGCAIFVLLGCAGAEESAPVPSPENVSRPAHRVKPEQVRSALESTLRAQGATAVVRDIELGVLPSVDTENPQLRVLDIRPDVLRGRWNARLVITGTPHSVPFLASMLLSGSLAPWREDAVVKPARRQFAFKAGDRARLLIRDAGFRVEIPVVCLAAGMPGQEIRVRDESNGKVHRVRVSEEGGVRWLGDNK